MTDYHLIISLSSSDEEEKKVWKMLPISKDAYEQLSKEILGKEKMLEKRKSVFSSGEPIFKGLKK